MTVHVQGDANGRVPKSLAHHFGVYPLPQQLRGVAVTEVVKPNPRKLGAANQGGKGVTNRTGIKRPTVTPCTDQIVVRVGTAQNQAYLSLFGARRSIRLRRAASKN